MFIQKASPVSGTMEWVCCEDDDDDDNIKHEIARLVIIFIHPACVDI